MKPRARVSLAFFGTLLYLALAILGWGGFSGFFSDPARVAVTLAFVAIAVAAPFAGGNISPGLREDRGNRWVLPVFMLLGLLGAFLPAFADRREIWVIDGEAVRWLGVVLFVIGAVLRLWPVYVLGDRFSGLVAIQPGHMLVTGGIYRHIRNPSYLGMVVNSLGWGLAFNNWVGVLLAALLLPPLIARMSSEERLLRGEFGAAYNAYCARTWRLVPGLY